MTPSAAPAQAATSALGFTSETSETHGQHLRVEGTIPDWLSGSLLRTGPAKFEVGEQTVNHWFDGLAKLHRFAFDAGRVSYTSRFLRSQAYEAAERDGKLAYREFATDPCRSAFRRVASVFSGDHGLTDNGAVNVVALGEQWLALTELPLPVAFDPETLETLGVAEPPPGSTSTAHPHVTPDGELWGHGVRFGARSAYQVYAQRPGERRVVGSLPVRRPGYMHSFALTERHAVLAESPFTVNPLRVALGSRTFAGSHEWRPQDGSRFVAFDRATGATRTWAADAFFCFHHVNAFEEEDGTLVVDLLAFEDAGVVDALSLGKLRAGARLPVPQLCRFRLRPGAAWAERELLTDVRFELPVTDYAATNGRPYGVVWGVGAPADGGWFDRIVRVDVATGEHREWHEPGTHPGEPVLAKRPGATAEDDGVLLTVLLEPERAASSLVVLDAASLEELGRARVEHHVPFGFHGAYVRGSLRPRVDLPVAAERIPGASATSQLR